MHKLKLSIIVPIFNEEGNIKPLSHKLAEALYEFDYEILMINDGSTDNSLLELQKESKQNNRIKIINFVRNFGQTAAWACGFDYAKGDILVTIDADLQNDPIDIPHMLKLMKIENADIVAGYRKNRKDPLLRSTLSKTANKIINWIMKAEIKDSGCSLRLIKRSAVQNLTLYGEMHRLLPFLLNGYGAKIVQTPVKHHPRTIGVSKYGLNRTFKVILDVITVKFLTTYQTKPIYMFGTLGFGMIFFSILSAILVFIRKIFLGGVWISPLFFITMNLFLFGLVTIMMGLLAEIQIRGWYESSNKKSYIIQN